MEPKLKEGLLVFTTNPFDLLAEIEWYAVMVIPIGTEEARTVARSARESGIPVVVLVPKDHPCSALQSLADTSELPKNLQDYQVSVVAVSPTCRLYVLAPLST
jgi:hypothetical protein